MNKVSTSARQASMRCYLFVISIFTLTALSVSPRMLHARQIHVAIGEEYGGGVVGCIFQPGDPGYVSGEQHGLIVSRSRLDYASVYGRTPPDTTDASYNEWLIKDHRFRWSTGVTASPSSPLYSGKPVGTSTAFGTGRSNTLAILALYPASRFKYTAAAMCVSYSVTVDGRSFDDWYLPSKDELARLALHQEDFGGLVYDNVFWSSSEDGPEIAWNYYLIRSSSDDIPDNVHKSGPGSVLAVRDF
jgi:hypothetical protein